MAIKPTTPWKTLEEATPPANTPVLVAFWDNVTLKARFLPETLCRCGKPTFAIQDSQDGTLGTYCSNGLKWAPLTNNVEQGI